jgi:hypothetical protein
LDFARRVPNSANSEITEGRPSEEWLDAHTGCGGNREASQRRILASLAPAEVDGVRAAGGKFASIAFGAVHDRVVVGVNLVATDPAQRRKGLPRRLGRWSPGPTIAPAPTARACRWSRTNAPAIAIYRSLGRTKERYRDHYRPQADEAWIKKIVEIRGD